jgi:hypothetical protein
VRRCVNGSYATGGSYRKCLGTIFISFTLFNNARLNFGCQLRTEFCSIFHSLTDEGTNEEFVEESLQKGTIRSLPCFHCTLEDRE